MLYITINQSIDNDYFLTDTRGIQSSEPMSLANARLLAHKDARKAAEQASSPDYPVKCKVIYS